VIRSTNSPTSPAESKTMRDAITENAHVVFLINFVGPNHVPVLQEVAKRVGKLTVLCSVKMESNRDFDPEWGDLDVVVQKTWTLSRTAHHPSGYHDVNYIHIPLDTLRQLRALKPDAVVSYELGARTAFSWLHRSLHRRCAVVAAVAASERSEAGRGPIRRFTRRRLLRRVDWTTYNGPSCLRYLQGLGASPEFMSPWDYSADPNKPYRGELTATADRSRLKLLTVGQLSARKGVLPAAEQLAAWAATNPNTSIQWQLLGTGPQESELRQFDAPPNLEILLPGHCSPETLRQHYRDSDALLFPTLGDEWGLVVDEALHSGLPVIGSVHAQAVSTLIVDNKNGWSYDPELPESLGDRLGQFIGQSEHERRAMMINARQSAASRTPHTAADQFIFAVANAIDRRHGITRSANMTSNQPHPETTAAKVISA
jgi:glycosyltransferase involved in cell wall biosynthesis